MPPIIRRVKSFFRFSKRQKLFFLWVVFLSLFRHLLAIIKSKKAITEQICKNSNPERPLTSSELELLKDIALVIKLGDTYIPWPNVCRHQSWQAVKMLSHYKIPFSFSVGAKKDQNGRLEGHSWVMVNSRFISGKCNLKEYNTIKTYHS
jgi:hypothetical protein